MARAQWLGVRLSLLGSSAMSTLAGLSMVFRGLTEPALVALAINYCLFLSQYLQYGAFLSVPYRLRFGKVDATHTAAFMLHHLFQALQ